MKTVMFALLFIASVQASAAAKTKIEWSVGVQENGQMTTYKGAELTSFLAKPLALKGGDAVCTFNKTLNKAPVENEKIGVSCVLGVDAYLVRTEVVCANVRGFSGMAPLVIAKPDPKKVGDAKAMTSMITIDCLAK